MIDCGSARVLGAGHSPFGLFAMVYTDSVHNVAQTGFGDGTNELYDRSIQTRSVYEITHPLFLAEPVRRTLRMLSNSSARRLPLQALST
jgi:hypothetical protein